MDFLSIIAQFLMGGVVVLAAGQSESAFPQEDVDWSSVDSTYREIVGVLKHAYGEAIKLESRDNGKPECRKCSIDFLLQEFEMDDGLAFVGLAFPIKNKSLTEAGARKKINDLLKFDLVPCSDSSCKLPPAVLKVLRDSKVKIEKLAEELYQQLQ